MIAFTNRGDEMIREDIMERLVCFSDEEINNLNGFVGIDKSIFISEQSNVVDADKLLKLISSLLFANMHVFVNIQSIVIII